MLDPESREKFFDHLVADFSPSPDALSRAADAYRTDPSQKNLIRLRRLSSRRGRNYSGA